MRVGLITGGRPLRRSLVLFFATAAIAASTPDRYTGNIMGNDFWNQTSVLGTPTRDSYQDIASKQHIGRGSTQAVALPQPLPGFVVERSTLEGAPTGWSSGSIASKVHVDPDVPGESFTVDMTNVTAAAFNKATTDAQVRQSISIDDLRNRASAVFRKFATDAVSVAPPPPPPREEPMETTNPGVTNALHMAPAQSPAQMLPMQPTTYAAPNPQYSPPDPRTPVAQSKAASFVQPQAASPAPPAPPAPPAAAAPTASLFDQVAAPRLVPAVGHVHTTHAAGAAPTYKLTFEVSGSGVSIDTWYHDVIRDHHILVLVYDTTCVGYPRSRLQPTDNDIAVHLAGSDMIYLVQDPAITFEFGTQEFQVLLIKAEHPYASDAVAE